MDLIENVKAARRDREVAFTFPYSPMGDLACADRAMINAEATLATFLLSISPDLDATFARYEVYEAKHSALADDNEAIEELDAPQWAEAAMANEEVARQLNEEGAELGVALMLALKEGS